MPANCFPALDLPFVFNRKSSAHMVSAIPLEPASRIVLFIDPSFFLPHLKRLTGVLMKEVECVIVMFRRKLGARKPVFRKLPSAIGHVLAAKNTEREHLLWCKFRFEIRTKIPSYRLGKFVFVTLLKLITHLDSLFSHECLLAYKIYDQQEQSAPPADVRDNEACHDFLLPGSRQEFSRPTLFFTIH